MKNHSKNKVKKLDEIVQIAEAARTAGKVVVTTNGCFDLIHHGHIQNLEWAKNQGDMLIVGINSDRSIKNLPSKGAKRPIVSEMDRALVIAGLAAVDYVFIFDDKSPISWILAVKPSIHVKGQASVASPDYIPEENAVKNGGGKLVLAPMVLGFSSTNIINRIIELYGTTNGK